MAIIMQQGMSQMTSAAKAIISSAFGKAARGAVTKLSRGRSKKRASGAKSKRTKRAKRASSSKSTASRLVKGSAAAKRYMAKIRKLRK